MCRGFGGLALRSGSSRLTGVRENDWIHEIGRGQTTISVAVSHPEVQHKVRIQDFERWLDSQGRTPAEMSLKARLRELLSEGTRVGSATTRNRI